MSATEQTEYRELSNFFNSLRGQYSFQGKVLTSGIIKADEQLNAKLQRLQVLNRLIKEAKRKAAQQSAACAPSPVSKKRKFSAISHDSVADSHRHAADTDKENDNVGFAKHFRQTPAKSPATGIKKRRRMRLSNFALNSQSKGTETSETPAISSVKHTGHSTVAPFGVRDLNAAQLSPVKRQRRKSIGSILKSPFSDLVNENVSSATTKFAQMLQETEPKKASGTQSKDAMWDLSEAALCDDEKSSSSEMKTDSSDSQRIANVGIGSGMDVDCECESVVSEARVSTTALRTDTAAKVHSPKFDKKRKPESTALVLSETKPQASEMQVETEDEKTQSLGATVLLSESDSKSSASESMSKLVKAQKRGKKSQLDGLCESAAESEEESSEDESLIPAAVLRKFQKTKKPRRSTRFRKSNSSDTEIANGNDELKKPQSAKESEEDSDNEPLAEALKRKKRKKRAARGLSRLTQPTKSSMAKSKTLKTAAKRKKKAATSAKTEKKPKRTRKKQKTKATAATQKTKTAAKKKTAAKRKPKAKTKKPKKVKQKKDGATISKNFVKLDMKHKYTRGLARKRRRQSRGVSAYNSEGRHGFDKHGNAKKKTYWEFLDERRKENVRLNHMPLHDDKAMARVQRGDDSSSEDEVIANMAKSTGKTAVAPAVDEKTAKFEAELQTIPDLPSVCQLTADGSVAVASSDSADLSCVKSGDTADGRCDEVVATGSSVAMDSSTMDLDVAMSDATSSQCAESAVDAKLDGIIHSVLKQQWGFDSFRPGQAEAIKCVLRRQSAVVLLPTGAGKSLCYQIPAYLFRKERAVTLVVSPLLSLMQDQSESLPDCLNGAAWNHTLKRAQVFDLRQRLINGEIDILYVSPEKLDSSNFRLFLSKKLGDRLKFACIDEAHCISEWSHNFRPSYLRLRQLLRDYLGIRTILALTATATKITQNAIIKNLEIPASNVISALRPRINLQMTVSHSNRHSKTSDLLKLLASERFRKLRSIIVYVALKADCQLLNARLSSRFARDGLKVEQYHGGLKADVRRQIQNEFMSGRLHIVVATIAFGMGLDKRDVRGVIHYSLPKTMEHYVQEVGRAGRDGLAAQCHLFYDEADVTRALSWIYTDGVDLDQVKYIMALIFCRQTLRRSKSKAKSSRSRRTSVTGKVNCGSLLESGVDIDEFLASAEFHDSGHTITLSEGNEFCKRLDVKSTVLHTVLTYLDIYHSERVKLLPKGYDLVRIGLLRGSDDKELADDPLLWYVFNNVTQRSNGMFTTRVSALVNAMRQSQNGTHLGTAFAMLEHLKALAAKRLIMTEFDDRCFFVALQKGVSSVAELNTMADAAYEYLCMHEKVGLEKINTLKQAMKLVAWDNWQCRTKQAAESIRVQPSNGGISVVDSVSLSSESSESPIASKANSPSTIATTTVMESTESSEAVAANGALVKEVVVDCATTDVMMASASSGELVVDLKATDMSATTTTTVPMEDVTLHSMVDYYFKCDTHDDFLGFVQSYLAKHEHIRTEPVSAEHWQHKEVLASVKKLLREYPSMRPRAMARILHGIHSPAYHIRDWKENSFWKRHTGFPFLQLVDIVKQAKDQTLPRV